MRIMNNIKCQMTISLPEFPGSNTSIVYCSCDKPAKFRNPKPEMGVKYVCGIHERSLNLTFERIGRNQRCLPIFPLTKPKDGKVQEEREK